MQQQHYCSYGMKKGSRESPGGETPEYFFLFYFILFFCLGNSYIFLKEGVTGEKKFCTLTNQQIYFFLNISEAGWCLRHKATRAKGLKPNLCSNLMEILSERDAPAD